jgi:hypothetical protein
MAHDASGATFFMIVSLPGDAAATICCSIDFPIFAVRFCQEDDEPLTSSCYRKNETCRVDACLMSAAFLGAIALLPFLGAAAALAA